MAAYSPRCSRSRGLPYFWYKESYRRSDGLVFWFLCVVIVVVTPLAAGGDTVDYLTGHLEDEMRVGFIGLGTMGRPMAENVAAAGHELTVNDVRPVAGEPLVARGARWASSPAEAARGAEVVLTSLPGPREVEAVVLGPDGVLAGAGRGTIYADLSTSSVSLI